MRHHQCAALNNDAMVMPERFVESLRVLFDILDTSRKGFISFEKLASKWHQLPTRGLPPDFLDCLQCVTPASGMLDFACFLAGVRMSLNERNYCMLCQRSAAANLHRVRSEGKLNDISKMDKESWRHFLNKNTKKFKGGPIMGVHLLFPHNKTNRAFASYSGQIQKRQEYRSQPDIFGQLGHTNKMFNAQENYTSSHNKMALLDESKNSAKRDIVMRPQKSKDTRAPLPPHGTSIGNTSVNPFANNLATSSSSESAMSYAVDCDGRKRPYSKNSVCSSGFSVLQSQNSMLSHARNNKAYAEEHQPQVAKHECLLAEEWSIVCKGAETTQRLQLWFQTRMESLKKRKSMLERGMVALNSAVHEQKLHFYQAQISELTRRMNALMGSSEHGFPTHNNMNAPNSSELMMNTLLRTQKSPHSNGSTSLTNRFSEQTLRCFSVESSSLGCSSPSSSTRTSKSLASSSHGSNSSQNSSPELKTFETVKKHEKVDLLVQQQQKLFEELDAKSRIIEKLQRENRMHEMRNAQCTHTMRKPAETCERKRFLCDAKKTVNDTVL